MTFEEWFVAASRNWLAVLLVTGVAIFPARLARADCSVTNLGVVPVPDLGFRTYKNVVAGLYPNGSNTRPQAHEAAGLSIATNEVAPRDSAGNLQTNSSGKIVLLSIGMSNTTQEWGQGFMPRAMTDPSKNPQLTIVDGAQGGKPATDWTNYNSITWSNVETRLAAAGVTTNQVQVIWMKQARHGPTEAFPLHAQYLQENLEVILRVAQMRYPNLKIAYLSSRTRSYATNVGALNPEPFAYESAFTVRWLIEKQLNGALNYDAANGAVVAPWLSWGPYLWADGENPRSDGFTWSCSDLQQSDFTHPSTTGMRKVGDQLIAFFKTDPTATPWYLKKSVVGRAPTCAPVAGVTSGNVPMQVQFSANASDPDGTIRDYQWTFEDGTFSTNANPVKRFTSPGTYQARLTVTDNNGNTALGTVTINATFPAARLISPQYANGKFQFTVSGVSNLNYTVQGSANFSNWVSLASNRGPFTFRDANAAGPERFYRALVQP